LSSAIIFRDFFKLGRNVAVSLIAVEAFINGKMNFSTLAKLL